MSGMSSARSWTGQCSSAVVHQRGTHALTSSTVYNNGTPLNSETNPFAKLLLTSTLSIDKTGLLIHIAYAATMRRMLEPQPWTWDRHIPRKLPAALRFSHGQLGKYCVCSSVERSAHGRTERTPGKTWKPGDIRGGCQQFTVELVGKLRVALERWYGKRITPGAIVSAILAPAEFEHCSSRRLAVSCGTASLTLPSRKTYTNTSISQL